MITAQRGETADYSDILRASAALAGFAPTDIGTPEFQLLRQFHDRRLKVAWEIHHWPQICLIEQRTFRAPFDTTGGTTYAAGAEVLDVPTQNYFQSLAANNTQPPTVAGVENSAYWALCRASYSAPLWVTGTSYTVGLQVQNPADQLFYQCTAAHTAGASLDPTKFAALTPFNRYVSRRQAWMTNAIGDFLAAWDRDPRVTTKTTKLPFTLSADGAQFTTLAHVTGSVWIYFRSPRPLLNGDVLDLGAVYAPGRTAYYTSTATGAGNFYVAQTTTTAGDTPDSAPSKWALVAIPYLFRDYLIQGGYADWLTSDGQADKATTADGMAMALLELEADNLQRQQQQTNRLDWRS